MSTELLVAILGLVAVAIPAGVEVWRARNRRVKGIGPEAAYVSAAQPLRDEAVTALVNAALSAEKLNSSDVPEAQAERKSLDLEYERLIGLNARLKIARGISTAEVEAFADAATMIGELFGAVATLQEQRARRTVPSADWNLDSELSSIDLIRDEFQIAFERFVEVAREAAI